MTGRPIPPKYFENIFKTNDSVGVTRQQTWLRNEKIADYFGENLDILTDLIWIFNNSNWIHDIFSKYFGGIGLLVTTATSYVIHFHAWLLLMYWKCPLNNIYNIKSVIQSDFIKSISLSCHLWRHGVSLDYAIWNTYTLKKYTEFLPNYILLRPNSPTLKGQTIR